MQVTATEADFPSGPWAGFYQQDGRSYPQQLELTFTGGVVRGGGWDGLGEFSIKGCYELDTREVRWTKCYESGRRLQFRGFREGRGIWGTWQDPGLKRAGFHIWPLADPSAE